MECCARQCVVPCLPQAAAAQRDMIMGKYVPRGEDILLFLDSDEGWWSDWLEAQIIEVHCAITCLQSCILFCRNLNRNRRYGLD